MALEKTFQEFSVELRKLRDRFQELRLTIVEDRPVKNEARLVDDFEYGIEDVFGWLGEAIQTGDEALRALGPPVDLDRARRSLTRCQEQLSRIEKRFSSSLVSYEKLDQLNKMGHERGGQWLGWANAVNQGLDRCRQPLEAVKKDLAACWEEIAEHVGVTNISVSTTNIGQKIVTPAPTGAAVGRETDP